jgi:hypothetical protein
MSKENLPQLRSAVFCDIGRFGPNEPHFDTLSVPRPPSGKTTGATFCILLGLKNGGWHRWNVRIEFMSPSGKFLGEQRTQAIFESQEDYYWPIAVNGFPIDGEGEYSVNVYFLDTLLVRMTLHIVYQDIP